MLPIGIIVVAVMCIAIFVVVFSSSRSGQFDPVNDDI